MQQKCCSASASTPHCAPATKYGKWTGLRNHNPSKCSCCCVFLSEHTRTYHEKHAPAKWQTHTSQYVCLQCIARQHMLKRRSKHEVKLSTVGKTQRSCSEQTKSVQPNTNLVCYSEENDYPARIDPWLIRVGRARGLAAARGARVLQHEGSLND